MSTNQQIAPLISKELKDLKEKINAVKKLKGEEKMKQSDRLKRAEIKRINNLITSYRVFIATFQSDQQSQQIQRHNKQIQDFQTTFNDIRRNLDYIRNQGIAQENLYADRNPKNYQGDSRQQLIKESFQDQQKMKDGVKRILVNLYEADDIMKNTNIELLNQIEKLDSIYDELEETDTAMRRAMKHISYFAKSVYTDKIMMGMIVIIVLAIIAIIVLSAMGKTGGNSSDVLT